MADREALFWGRIVSGLWRPNRMLLRIESGVSDGVPDAYICLANSANWLELKAPIEPARAGTALFGGSNHKLSLAQRNWLLAHRQAGGRGWIAVETERWMFLCGARLADEINRMTLNEFVTASDLAVRRPVQELGWGAFVDTLCGGVVP